jgi:hypothetical protein
MASKKVLLLCGDYMEDYEVSIQSLLVYFAPLNWAVFEYKNNNQLF